MAKSRKIKKKKTKEQIAEDIIFDVLMLGLFLIPCIFVGFVFIYVWSL